MKKLLALLLAMMLVFSLAACGDNNTTDPDKDNPGTSQSDNQGGTENQGGWPTDGFEENTTEDNALNIQVRIAEIDAEFKAMLSGVSSDTVDAFDDEKASALIMEKTELQKQLEQLQEIQQKRINTKHRLDDIYTILDGLKNRPMEYDDQMVRQILECVTVDSKEQITVIFIGGLKIKQSLLDC